MFAVYVVVFYPVYYVANLKGGMGVVLKARQGAWRKVI